MCGRYAIYTDDDEEFRRIIDLISKDPLLKTGEIFPSEHAPIITSSDHVLPAVWGLPKYGGQKGLIINARSETIHEKFTFKNLLKTGRCLIPASEYYEWETIEKQKIRYRIKTPDTHFYMAGLFSDHDGPRFTILTTEASLPLIKIHDRMPVIMTYNEGLSYLNGDLSLIRHSQKQIEISKF